jgi:hypothetical protein
LHLLKIGTMTPSVVNGVYETFYVVLYLTLDVPQRENQGL